MLTPRQSIVARTVHLALFLSQRQEPRTLRGLQRLRGDRFRVFGGTAYCRFYDVQALLSAGYEPLDWFAGPLDDRADYLTKSYAPFLLAGPNRRLRREHVGARTRAALGRLDELQTLLGEEDAERALARFLFRTLGRIPVTRRDLDDLLYYRAWGGLLMLLPKWLRARAFPEQNERMRAFRGEVLARMELAGEPLADSIFDLIWFELAPVTGYARRALSALERQPELMAEVAPEMHRPPAARGKTRALVCEMMRLWPKAPAKLYFHENEVKVAALANAAVDPIRYAYPLEIDLERDASDMLLGDELSIALASCLVAHALRTHAPAAIQAAGADAIESRSLQL